MSDKNRFTQDWRTKALQASQRAYELTVQLQALEAVVRTLQADKRRLLGLIGSLRDELADTRAELDRTRLFGIPTPTHPGHMKTPSLVERYGACTCSGSETGCEHAYWCDYWFPLCDASD